ncbi:ABC transporter ATP-binding protein [Streptomyces sp. NBC_00459]|uniref:ABC transporter ATP-binding protein n=1 Tax=Streptomyces sp. NBC_00459 TaxID=2975749 RepID=UPI002E193776
MTTSNTTTDEALLEVAHLSVDVLTDHEVCPIVTDVGFRVRAGEALGIVGESGSGKSMTVRAVQRLLARGVRARGTVTFDGRDVYGMSPRALRDWRASEIAMIHQDPRAHINPVRTVGDFLTEGLRLRKGTSRRVAAARAVSRLAEVGIPDGERRLAQYPHQLSGGLLQRVMIAAALLAEPRLIIADEPTTALDVTTQEEVMAILDEQRRERGLAMILITHDLDLAAAVCDRLAVMYAGAIAETGIAAALREHPLHPYTAALLASRPSTSARVRLAAVPGRPSTAYEIEHGCVFAPRCPHAQPLCQEQAPAPRPLDGHQVACHRAEELRGHLNRKEMADHD